MVQDQDFAVYNCTAVNDYGTAFMAITFAKKGDASTQCINIAPLNLLEEGANK